MTNWRRNSCVVIQFFILLVRRIRFSTESSADSFPPFKETASTPKMVSPPARPLPKYRPSSEDTASHQMPQTVEDFDQLPKAKRRKLFSTLVSAYHCQNDPGENIDSDSSDDGESNKISLSVDMSVETILEHWALPPNTSTAELREFYKKLTPYKPKKGIGGPKSHYNLHNINGLVLTLIILRTGMSFQNAAHFLGPSANESSARACFNDWVQTVYSFSEDKNIITFLTLSEWRKECHTKSDFIGCYPNKLIYFVDGTPIEVLVPSDPVASFLTFNTKHQMNAFTFFIMVTPTGKIVYVSNLEAGGTHDATHFRAEQVVQKLTNFYKLRQKNLTLCIGGDKGYRAVEPPPGWKMLITKSGEKSGDDGQSISAKDSGMEKIVSKNIEFDEKIAKHRSVVERVFSKLKLWQILTTKRHLFRTTLSQKNVFVICSIYNYFYKTAP